MPICFRLAIHFNSDVYPYTLWVFSAWLFILQEGWPTSCFLKLRKQVTYFLMECTNILCINIVIIIIIFCIFIKGKQKVVQLKYEDEQY